MPTEIKISAQMDTQSFRQVANAIQQLVTTVDKLNASMSTLGQSIGKIKTGGMSQGVAAIKNTQGKQSGGIIGAVVGEVGNVASQTDRALNDVSGKLTRFVERSKSDLKSLATAITGVGNSGQGSSRDQQMIRFATGSSPGWANQAISTIDSRRPPPQSTAPSPQQGGGGGFNLAGLVAGGTGGLEALARGNIGGFLGSTVGRLGIAGAAAYGAYRVADAAGGYVNDLYGANQQFALTFPVQQQQAVAATMAPFKQFGMAHQNWDLRTMIGSRRALTSSAGQNIYGRQDLWQETVGTKLKEAQLSGALSNAFSRLVDPIAVRGYDGAVNALASPVMSGGAGMIPGGFTSRGFSTPSSAPLIHKRVLGDITSTYEMTKAKLELDIGPRQAALTQDLVQAEMAKANSAEEYMMGAYSGGGALSRVQALRAMGRSTSPIKFRDGSRASAYEWLEASALEHGRTLGDNATAYHQVNLGIGKDFARMFGTYGSLSAAEAGYTNITQSAKVWGMLTGSVRGANAIENNVNGRGGMVGGSGGLDVTVARDLFQDIAQTGLSSGMYGSSSLNQVNRMLGTFVFGGGADSAGQHRNAYAYGLGAQLERSMTSGARSPFDKAASWQDSVYATGGSFDARTIRLQEMGATDPRLLASIAYGGAKVPRWAQGIIDQESAQGYFESARKRTFATVVDEQWANLPTQSSILKKIRSGGNDPNKALDEMLQGKKVGSKEWFNAHWEAVETMGGILGGNKMANAAKISEDYLRTKVLGTPSGPGAHSPDPAALEKEVARNRAAYEKELSKEMASTGSKVISDRRKDEIAERFGLKDHIFAEMKSGANDIPQLSDNFVKAAADLANAIKAKAGKKANGAG